MKRKINWNKGNATLLASMSIILLLVALTWMYIAFADSMYVSAIASTRADATADAAAIYAQSYDYKYNKAQAGIMTTLLGTYNNSTAVDYQLVTSVTFPEDDTLTVRCEAVIGRIFPSLVSPYAAAGHETTVKSVDIYGDVVVVPEGFGDPKPDDTSQANPGDADISMP